MKQAVLILLTLLSFSCIRFIERDSGADLKRKLFSLDRKVYQSPSDVLDSLFKYREGHSAVYNPDNQFFNREINALSNLIYSIAYEQQYGVFKNDSIIDISYQWYKNSDNHLNKCRAILYKAVALHSKDRYDSLAYSSIREAEKIYLEELDWDNNLGATLYKYLGKFHRSNSNNEMAGEAFKKSLELSKKGSNKNQYLSASLDLFGHYLRTGDYSRALEAISVFGNESELPGHLEYSLNYNMFNYYAAKNDRKIALEYLKKILQMDSVFLRENANIPRLYYQLSNMYSQIGMIDSAAVHAQNSVDAVKDSTSLDSHFYYRYLGDIHARKGDYKTAYNYYKEAHSSYVISYARLSLQRSKEIESRFNLGEYEKRIETLEAGKSGMYTILVILSLLFILTLVYSVTSIKKRNEQISNLDSSLDDAIRENDSQWLISEMFKITSHTYPKLVEGVYREAARSRKISKETFESLNKIIDDANSTNRSSLSSITAKERFNKILSGFNGSDNLTEFEKLVFVLGEEGFNNSQIADFLHSSQSSIRTTRGKILKKISKNYAENSTEQQNNTQQ
jgi:tetratricopeptide (TPR) repeat protein